MDWDASKIESLVIVMNRRLAKWTTNGSALFFLTGVLLLGAYSISRPPEAEFRPAEEVQFPRYDEEKLKLKQAKRPFSKNAYSSESLKPQDAGGTPTEPDPILRGLRALPESNGLMVLEANAIKHSWIFEAMEGCLDFQTIDLPKGFPEDFDIMESVDRVATGDGVAMVSGFFDGIDWDAAIGAPLEERSDAKIFEATEGRYFAIWDNQMMVTADSRERLDNVLNGLADPSSLPDSGGLESKDVYGDIYGKLKGAVLQNLVPQEYQDQITPELLEALEGVDFHVDTSQGLAMSAQVQSSDNETLKALKFVMKLALDQAQSSVLELAEEDTPMDALGLAQALEASQIGAAEDGALNFDLALPREVMEGFLREACSQLREDDASSAEDELSEQEFEEATDIED